MNKIQIINLGGIMNKIQIIRLRKIINIIILFVLIPILKASPIINDYNILEFNLDGNTYFTTNKGIDWKILYNSSIITPNNILETRLNGNQYYSSDAGDTWILLSNKHIDLSNNKVQNDYCLVMPQPFDEYIRLILFYNKTTIQIKISDLTGQIYYENTFNDVFPGFQILVRTDHLKSGLYLLCISDNITKIKIYYKLFKIN